MARAARFLYLQRTTFGGKISGRTFGVSRAKPASFDLSKLTGLLEEVHERLSGVVIECLPYADFTARYDRLGALFYLDPPYYGCKTQYGAGLFARDDFSRMAEILPVQPGRIGVCALLDVRSGQGERVPRIHCHALTLHAWPAQLNFYRRKPKCLSH